MSTSCCASGLWCDHPSRACYEAIQLALNNLECCYEEGEVFNRFRVEYVYLQAFVDKTKQWCGVELEPNSRCGEHANDPPETKTLLIVYVVLGLVLSVVAVAIVHRRRIRQTRHRLERVDGVARPPTNRSPGDALSKWSSSSPVAGVGGPAGDLEGTVLEIVETLRLGSPRPVPELCKVAIDVPVRPSAHTGGGPPPPDMWGEDAAGSWGGTLGGGVDSRAVMRAGKEKRV